MTNASQFARVFGDYQANIDRLPDPQMLLNIPTELRTRPCWLIWKLERDKGRQTKVPYQTRTPAIKASSTAQKTWSGFWDTVAVYLDDLSAVTDRGSPDLIAGIGSAFNGDGICGIDLDGCIQPDGNIDPDFISILKGFRDTYTEVSWSGTGLHIIIRCDDPPDDFTTKWTGKFKEKMEVALFSNGRYFTFNGKVYDETATGIKTYTGGEVLEILKSWIPVKKQPQRENVFVQVPQLGDRDIIDLASNARNGSNFLNLYHGNWSRYPSMSEADMGLASIIGFYTQDVPQISRIMHGSGLMRDKWTKRPDYLQETIRKALEGQSNTYNPKEIKCKMAEEGRRILAQWGAT
jgi:primase-polymerase (primpol)-like protein